MQDKRVPVLILGYLRFENIMRILESCVSEDVGKVYLSLDGTKNEAAFLRQSEAVENIFKYAYEKNLMLQIRRRASNGGLAVAVIEGISWFFENEDFGIILEDDLQVSESFFSFVSKARLQYQAQSNIALISGNNYFAEIGNSQVSATQYPLIWGWATWKHEWVDFVSALNAPLRVSFNRGSSLRVNLFWLTAAIQSRVGLVDSWAMSFSYFLRLRKKICLLPPVNLVTNLGSDSIAAHSNKHDEFIGFPLSTLPSQVDFSIPRISDTRLLDEKLEKYIYKISFRHLISPFKLAFKLLKYRKEKTLSYRLLRSKLEMDYSINRGG